MELKVAVTVQKENDCFVAVCEEYKLLARNVTVEDALTDLQRKLHEYLDDEQPSIKASIVFVIQMPI
jgi:predicted RNase H-like HicB family nuclease